jgi:glutamate racemase
MARPIGMFDSGFGGLTVARAVIDLLPREDLVYLGDTGRYPYGPRTLDEVRRFARQITRLLVDDHDVKLVVVARTISDVVGRDVVLVSSADETAFEIRALLGDDSTAAGSGTHRFLSSGDPDTFVELGFRLLGPELASAERVEWG